MKMDIVKKTEGGKLTIVVTGRVDTTTSPQLAAELENLSGVEKLELDMSGVPYMSSAGLRCLLVAQKAMMKSGGEMVISGVVPAVREVFDITGFSDLFTLV